MISLVIGLFLLFYCLFQLQSTSNIFVDRVLFSLVWSILFLFNGTLGDIYLQDNFANLLVFCFVLAFLLGHHTFTASIKSKVVRRERGYGFKGIGPFVVVCSIFGFWAPYDIVSQGGAVVAQAQGYAQHIAAINAEVRTGQIEQGMIGKIAFAMPQAAVLVLGLYLALAKIDRRSAVLLVLCAFMPLFAFTFVSTIRGPIFIAIVLLAAGYGAGLTLRGMERALFSARNVIGATFIALLLVAMMAFFQSFRLGDSDFSELGRTVEHMRIWFAGYLPAFRGWYLEEWDGSYTWGASTVRFLASLVAGSTSYLDTFQSNIYVGAWRYGNASTAFRVIVNDFGVLGCAVFMFLWGGVSAFLVHEVRRGHLIWAVFLAINIATIVWSPNQWFLMYGSRVLAVGIAVFYILARRVTLSRPVITSGYNTPSSGRYVPDWRAKADDRRVISGNDAHAKKAGRQGRLPRRR